MIDLENLNEHLKLELRRKCLFLGTVYKIASEEYSWTARQVSKANRRGISWADCCKKAVDVVVVVHGSKFAIKPYTLEMWNKVFQIEKRIISKLLPKMNLHPPFLLNNPTEVSLIATWVRSNLDQLSARALTEYIMDTLMITMAKQQILVDLGS